MEDVNLLLSFMETEILKGKKNRLTGGVSVNADNMLGLLNRIRAAVNAMNGEALIEESKERARLILEDAEKERAKMLNRDAAMMSAQVIAQKHIEDAEAYRRDMEESADKYAMNILVSARNNISGLEKALDNAIAQLKK